MSDWQHVQNIFFALADLPASEQDRLLHDLCGGDEDLLQEVRSLLDADCESANTIDSAIQGVAGKLFESPAEIGQRFGVYRIEREIGRGGMGSVYLAMRDDDEYKREVALKVVKRNLNNEEVLRRFRDERQILANLDHPYIARLFDGGSTPEGVPFFVMEYVEGRPIDVYCREQNLSIKARCALFLRVLEAVSYAHRNLVVHGDLKPANIFVTIDSTPKLLDFGVAELVSKDNTRGLDATRRAFTPGYASPEQVRGLTVTTATDIYSLGAVFYELLCGVRAQPIDYDTPTRIEQAVCRQEINRPALTAKGIPLDLECVVFKALNKQQEQRYESASQFADDIQRTLDRRPVKARANTWSYRTSRFVIRNYLSVMLVALVALALIGGLAVSLVQTHRARRDRAAADAQRQIALQERAQAEAARVSEAQQRTLAVQQRRFADEQKALAETERDEAQNQKATADQRLKDLMHLADSTLFDVHAAIASLPGSMQARRQIVQTTLDYLKTFENNPGTNDDMREALALAYYKVALIQGDPHGPSLQDSTSAEASLRKGEAILIPAYTRHPNEPGLMMRWIEIRYTLSALMYRSGREQEAIAYNIALLPIAHRMAQMNLKDLAYKTQEIPLENNLAFDYLTIDPKQAIVHANRGAEITRDLIRQYPNEASLKQQYGAITAVAAGANKNLGNLEEAAEGYRQSIQTREDLLRADPNSITLHRNVLVACGNYAALLGIPWSQNFGRPEEAHKYAARSVELARWMVNADPKDATAKRDLALSLSREGMIDPGPGQTAASLAELEEAEQLIEPMMAANAKSSEISLELATLLEYKAHRLEALNRSDEAMHIYLKSLALLQPFAGMPNAPIWPQYVADTEGLALLYAARGDKPLALKTATDAVDFAQKAANEMHTSENRVASLGGAWSTLATVQSRTGSPELARQSAAKALSLWDGIQRKGLLTSYRQSVAQAHMLAGNAGGGGPKLPVETTAKYFFAQQ